ncbi:27341_t:CDS:2, partial [Dentiscutata erythropus]
DKLEEGTAFLSPVTDDEDTMPEDDPAEVVACKTKKSRKRIRAKVSSSSCKKNNQTNPDKSQTDPKEWTSTTSNPQQTTPSNDDNNDNADNNDNDDNNDKQES